MIRTCARGTALPETALTIGLSLLLILGASQLAIVGFTQLSADGAAFVGAHTVATSPTANPAAAVQQAFPGIASANLAVAQPTPGAALEQAVVRKTVGGFIDLPGAAPSYAITGNDVEAAPQAAGTKSPSFAFGANAVLLNYCPAQGGCELPASYGMYLAQTLSTGGNGVNGQFSEWICHSAYFNAVAFPSVRPTPGPSWDPSNPASGAEYQIYSWDRGTPCS